jgi:phage repressor protein C with HTH and peptisase S24 domain
MAPAIKHGDQLLVWLRPPRRLRPGTLVVLRRTGGGLAVKRLVRVGTDGTVWIEGDNPFGSTDSRDYGPLPAAALVGRVFVRLWPRPGQVGPSH